MLPVHFMTFDITGTMHRGSYFVFVALFDWFCDRSPRSTIGLNEVYTAMENDQEGVRMVSE